MNLNSLVEPPAPQVFTRAGYTFSFRKAVSGLCILTMTGGKLPIPFHMVVRSFADAQENKAPAAIAKFEKGECPDEGVFRMDGRLLTKGQNAPEISAMLKGDQTEQQRRAMEMRVVGYHQARVPERVGNGWEPIPGGKHGGSRKRTADGGWDYHYPNAQAAIGAARSHRILHELASEEADAHAKRGTKAQDDLAQQQREVADYHEGVAKGARDWKPANAPDAADHHYAEFARATREGRHGDADEHFKAHTKAQDAKFSTPEWKTKIAAEDGLVNRAEAGHRPATAPAKPKKGAPVERRPNFDNPMLKAVFTDGFGNAVRFVFRRMEKGDSWAQHAKLSALGDPKRNPNEHEAKAARAAADAMHGRLTGASGAKAGEGSRGGHIIGHTSSGKPVYAPTGGTPHPQATAPGFTAKDHEEARFAHHYEMHEAMKRGDYTAKAGHERASVEHAASYVRETHREAEPARGQHVAARDIGGRPIYAKSDNYVHLHQAMAAHHRAMAAHYKQSDVDTPMSWKAAVAADHHAAAAAHTAAISGKYNAKRTDAAFKLGEKVGTSRSSW